jgi:DNA-binding LytR/AlgR family response regulator
MILRIAACDDNKKEMSSLLNLIEKIMKEYSISYYICEFTSGGELLASDLSFHLIFLDIMLGDKNGIEIGNYIYRKNRNIKIIFQTNYSQYCKEAMNRSHAFAFLDKPLQKEEVEEQLIELIENNEKLEKIRVDFKNIVFMRNGKEIKVETISLPVNDIIYFEYMKKQKK